MANRDAAMGFRAVYHLTGGVIRPNKHYTIASGLANDIGYGDPVKALSTGTFAPNVDAADTVGTDEPFVGVFAGCTYTNLDGDYTFRRNWVSGTATLNSVDAFAWVYDDPFIIYEIQCDDGSADNYETGDAWDHADIVYAAPDSLSGTSRVELDTSNIGTGEGLHIMGLVKRTDNALAIPFAKVYVMINEHALRNSGSVSAQNL
jgi:hypothetical protein